MKPGRSAKKTKMDGNGGIGNQRTELRGPILTPQRLAGGPQPSPRRRPRRGSEGGGAQLIRKCGIVLLHSVMTESVFQIEQVTLEQIYLKEKILEKGPRGKERKQQWDVWNDWEKRTLK